ncbi:MAG: hypothetical protein IPJ77_14465 [Planctomycetes bacterium]|nr:hypothetical protein [Planctomycetota bacterium]
MQPSNDDATIRAPACASGSRPTLFVGDGSKGAAAAWGSLLFAAGALVLGASTGCRAAPHAPDARARVTRVDARLVNAASVRVELVRVNGVRVADEAWSRALATLRACVAGPVEVVEHAPLALPANERGELLAPFEWPVVAPGERDPNAVVERELLPGAWSALERERELVGLVSFDPDGARSTWPVVAPNVLLVALVRRDAGARELHGWCRPLYALDAGGALVPSGSLIVLQTDVIAARASWLVSETKLAQHTLVHEFGHALGLPVDPGRAWIGPHFGAHCTVPRCVLYPAFDWRSVWSGVLDGWPLEFCAACRGELAAVRVGR